MLLDNLTRTVSVQSLRDSACLSDAVSKAEDPEKILEQAVNDMQGDLIKMRQASAQVLDIFAVHYFLAAFIECCLYWPSSRAPDGGSSLYALLCIASSNCCARHFVLCSVAHNISQLHSCPCRSWPRKSSWMSSTARRSRQRYARLLRILITKVISK